MLTLAARRRLLLQYVAELGERAQQLPTLDRRARAEFTGGRDAEERVGNRLPQLRRIPPAAQRVQLPRKSGIDLVDVDRRGFRGAAESDVTACRADVADRHRHVAGQLPLDVD